MRCLFALVMAAAAFGANPPCDFLDRLRAGDCYANRGEWKQAEAAYREASQHEPGSVNASVGHARALATLNQPFDALLELEAFLRDKPGAISAAKLYAVLCDSVLADHSRALEVLEQTAQLTPSDPAVWMALGSHYVNLNKPLEAIQCYEKAQALSPSDQLLLASLAYSYGEAQKFDSADQAFAKALAGQPEIPAIYVLHGAYLLKRGNFTGAEQSLDRALALDPHISDAYFQRGLTHERLKQFDRAESDAHAAIREGGERLDAHLMLQRVYRKQANQQGVEKEAQIMLALQEKQDKQQALGRSLREKLNAAEPLLAQQKYAEAIPYYQAIAGMLPNFYEAWFALGVSYSQTNQLAKAEQAFKRYLEFQPLSADGQAAFGLLLLKQKRTAEAKLHLTEALRLDPSIDEVREALAHL